MIYECEVREQVWVMPGWASKPCEHRWNVMFDQVMKEGVYECRLCGKIQRCDKAMYEAMEMPARRRPVDNTQP